MPAHKDNVLKARKGAASHKRTIAAAFASDVNLSTRSGCPDHAPQLVDFFNSGTAIAMARYTDYAGNAQEDPVPAGQHYPVEIPIATLLATSDDTISAKCYWWQAEGSVQNA